MRWLLLGVSLAVLAWLLLQEGGADSKAQLHQETVSTWVPAASPEAELTDEVEQRKSMLTLKLVNTLGERVLQGEVSFVRLNDWSFQFKGAVDSVHLDGDDLLPEGILSVASLGYLPIAFPVQSGTSWSELVSRPIQLNSLAAVFVVEPLGETRRIGLYRSSDRDLVAGKSVQASPASFGLGEQASSVEVGPFERLVCRFWRVESENHEQGLVALIEEANRTRIFDLRLSLPTAETPYVEAFKMPARRAPVSLRAVELEFDNGGANWWGEWTPPDEVILEVRQVNGVSGEGPGEEQVVFGKRVGEGSSYRFMVPEGDLMLTSCEQVWPMPAAAAVSLPIVDGFVLRASSGSAANPVPLVHDSRLIDLPSLASLPDLPGVRWLLRRRHSNDAMHNGSFRFGAFQAVLPPGDYELIARLGVFAAGAEDHAIRFSVFAL